MIGRRSTFPLAVLLCGGLVAGCGSSSSTTSSSVTAAQTAPAAVTSTPAAATGTTPAGASPSVPSSEAAGIVAACKEVIAEAPTLPASTKAKVEGICNKAASGNIEGARKAAKEVCTEVINAEPIPAGAAKEEALANCKKA